MYQHFHFLLFFSLLAKAQYNNTQCDLSQIASQFDCLHYKDGNTQWNSTLCQKNETSSNPKTVEVDTTPTYCNLLKVSECAADENCALVKGECTHFTGCTAFVVDNCQSISIRCTFDGKQCVEIGQCDNFLTERACQLDENRDYCYWDGLKCGAADSCAKLPSSLKSDIACRQEIQECTVSISANGCQESGTKCEDQLNQNQCYWNMDQSQDCFWNGTSCVDKICQNALLTLVTDAQCMNFLSTCTTKLNGGCIERSDCLTAKIQAACVKDSNGDDCYWDIDICVDKICENAPDTFVTNTECEKYLSNCITNGAGCVTNVACSSAKIEVACIEDPKKTPCIWSGSCQNIKCNLAPKTLLTNAECSQFLTGCVTTKDGGCIELTICSQYNIEQACVINKSGNECYWTIDGRCVDRTCANAPTTLTTHDDCYSYSQDCTIKSTGSGCVEQTCQNTLTQELCLYDYQGNLCTYIDKCYRKSCSLAKFNTALECHNYLNECTLDISGIGCSQIPLSCYVNKIKEACYYSLAGECGWNTSMQTCIAKSCQTADPLSTNAQCNTYLAGCVVSNGVGCMVLPKTCVARKREENCEFAGDTCVWGNSLCQERSCGTAAYEITSYTTDACKQYIDCSSNINLCCISNNVGTNCQEKSKCDTLGASNCTLEAQIDGDCYWNGQQCLSRGILTCADLIALTSHSECQNEMSSCTIDNDNIGCIDLAATCAGYTQNQCHLTSDQKICLWKNGACVQFNCSDAPDSNNYVNDTQCNSFQYGCTVSSNIGGCVDKFDSCAKYLKSESCYKTLTNGKCYWYNNICHTANTCSDITFLSTYTTQMCEGIIFDCKVNTSNNGCISKTCTDYSYTTLEQCQAKGACSINVALTQCIALDACQNYSESNCKYSSSGYCVWNLTQCTLLNQSCNNFKGDATTCPLAKNICIDDPNSENCKADICGSKIITSSSLMASLAICKQYDPTCSSCADLQNCVDANDQPRCIDIRQCSQYSEAECFYGLEGYCTRVKSGQVFQGCRPISISECSLINIAYLEEGVCDLFSIYCTDSTIRKQQCMDRSCSNKPAGVGYTQSICLKWLGGCTSTLDGTRCVDQKSYCSDYSVANCAESTTDGKCVIYNNACVPGNCGYASNTLMSNSECEAFLGSCTVAKIGGCEERKTNCADYLLMKQCYYDIEGKQCFWNPTWKNCVELSCANIETTVSFATTAQCKAVQNVDCIARVSGYGCEDNQEQCQSLQSQQQCTTDKSGQECAWFSNSCILKSCSTAPTAVNTHSLCLSYYTLDKCTTKTGGGCVSQQDSCSKYSDKASCIITTKNIDCGWYEIGNQCQVKSCQTAPLSNINHSQCNSYINTCTVANLGAGCITIPAICEGRTQAQCQTTNCRYDDASSSCLTRTCDNIPDDQSDCTAYLSTCQSDNIKCKDAICEYYQFTLEAECKAIMPKCTTDGTKCVPRTTCAQMVAESGCVSQLDGKLCQWLGNSCVVKECSTAPKSLTTYTQCSQYLSNCTAKADGGCTNLTLCTSYFASNQCVVDDKGVNCVWDTTQCRYKQCSDYFGSTHKACQQESSDCTVDLSTNHCMDIQVCSSYSNKINCIIGTDGICLWVQNQCYKYSQCEDIPFTTHDECQLVSKNCTTDGITCVPITFCADTNVNGGCVVGIDGDCIEIDKDGITSCALYKSCEQLTYLTHSLCNSAKSTCTTDGIAGCIALSTCISYQNKSSCVLDAAGKVVSKSQVQSTGNCVWDSNICRDQSCLDQSGKTNALCESQLYKCTSDGSKCITKVQCSDYSTATLCNIAKSDIAYCFWEIFLGKCRTIGCTDISNPTSVNYCKEKNPNCTFDGKTCIAVAKCAEYKTGTSCNSQGTDGMCAWIPPATTDVKTQSQRNVCFVMQECSSANFDQGSCLQARKKCYFQPATNTTTSSCIEHTCQTYYLQNQQCQYFYNWNETIITPCILNNKNCSVLLDPKTLGSQQCYLLSGYTYTFNASLNSCVACQNITKAKNETHVQYAILMSVSIVALLI